MSNSLFHHLPLILVLVSAIGCGGNEDTPTGEDVSDRTQAISSGCTLTASRTWVTSGDTVTLEWDWPDQSACKAGTVSCYRSAVNCNVSDPFCNYHRGLWQAIPSSSKGRMDLLTWYQDSRSGVPSSRVYAPKFSCSCIREPDGSPIGCYPDGEQWIKVDIKP